jgi:outer membrane lipoprotein-sorting protein
MNKTALFSALLLFSFLIPMAAEQDAGTILSEMEHTLYPDSYYMRMKMSTSGGSGRDREMEFDSLYRKGTGTYMEILSPARSKGTRFLEKDGALWMFVPRSNSRTPVRLPAGDSFQGSAFSNDDVSSSSYSDDYSPKLIGREEVDHPELGKVQCHVLELTPLHREAAYGRIKAWVSVDGSVPLRMDYFVRSGLRSKQMHLSDIRQAAGRRRPMIMTMENLDESGRQSVV